MGDPGAEPRLVVPEGLVIDESVRERLERQLAIAPDACGRGRGRARELAPGASYRVHAEWTALETPWSGARARGGIRFGARCWCGPTSSSRCATAGSRSRAGAVLVDPGAHVHDPFRPIGPLQAASERVGRRFPRRPVVVFLGCEPPADGDWVRRLVNRLVRRDVEARIAMPDAAGGSKRRRCTSPARAWPSEATIRALAPDVVVTLDPTAAAQVDAWCAGDRSTVVVAFDRTLADPMELVSWQIGHASGRLRARIGPRVDVPAFAALVVRLCAGPHPMPPSDEPELLADANGRCASTGPAAQPPARPRAASCSPARSTPRRRRASTVSSTISKAAGISVAVAPLRAGSEAVPARRARAAPACSSPASASSPRSTA